ncbi:MAG: SDR family oxidoreductase [Bacillota bacterium]|nr:SDR family oxidoreductase [Bacillota bacterium]
MTSDSMNIAGKTAIVTGGTGVLCSQMAIALAKAGANIVIIALGKAQVQKVVKEIESLGVKALGFEADVLNESSLREVREDVLEQLGSIDILVNGAGGNAPKATTSEEQSFFDLSFSAVSDVFALNFLGTFLPSQIFGEVMVQQKEGVIVNISSASSFHPMTRVVAYSAAKAAINNFTEWLAVHMGQEYSPAIRVNAIAPGFFIAEQNHRLLVQPDGEYTERGQKILANTPMARFGEPDDLIGALLWLVSDASRFVTGTVVNVDGGFNAYSGV